MGTYHEAFIMAFTLAFPAEMYDKSQIMILFLLTVYSPHHVFAGAIAGVLLANVPVILLASWTGQSLSPVYTSAICFVFFALLGLYMLYSRPPGNTIKKQVREFANPVYSCTLACFATEFGDKTQGVMAGLALHYSSPVPIIMGFAFAVILCTYLIVTFKDMVTVNIFQLYRLSGYVFVGFGLMMGLGMVSLVL